MRIGVIIGSNRTARKGHAIGTWVAEQAAALHPEVEFEIVDLAEHPLPFYTDEVLPAMAGMSYSDPAVTAWSRTVAGFDGFILVSPEYNHGVPAPMKNAFDSLFPEWFRKSVAFVGYGATGGIRVVEQWRAIMANAAMGAARNQVAVSIFTDLAEDGSVAPSARLEGDLKGLLGELVPLTDAMTALRTAQRD